MSDTVQNGKGDAPRNCFSQQYRDNYDNIFRKDKKEDNSKPGIMVKINGKSFGCNCGCNVFHHPENEANNIYECNACGEWYEGF